MAYTISNARNKLKADKANPADYGLRSWDQANYQTLANAIGDIVVKDTYYNKGISDAVRANRILAYPGGSTDPVTKEKLTEEQTQQAVASYTKDNAIAEIKNQAQSYYDSVYYQSNLTPKGKEVAKQTADAAAKALYEKVKNYVSPSEFDSIFSQQVVDRQKFLYDAALKNAKEDSRGGVLGFLDKATPVITNIGAGIISGGLTLPQQLAVSAAVGVSQGANVSDIVRNIVGTLAAAQIGGEYSKIGAVNDFNNAVAAIKSQELQSAIFNAARQGVYATVTEQDIAKNMAAGAVAGAIATNVQGRYNDPALSNAVGEFVQAKIAGKTDFDAIASALSGFATEEQRANAKKVISDEISGLPLDQVQALGYKTQDEITGSFYPKESEKLPEVVVTGQRDPQDIDGLSLVRRVRTGREVDREGSLPSVEVIGQREEEETAPLQRPITEDQEQAKAPADEEPALQRVINRPVLLGLLGGGISRTTQNQRTQRTPNEREAASMQALSQALSVGDAGDALFGSGLGRRRNVWNVESLRLKDELGG
jgi:hypothetical protein